MGNEKNKVNVLGVIPARMASVRLPEKPLKMIYGKTLIQRVWERACTAKSLSEVVIATDDSRIEAAALGFGAQVVMTDPELPSGSARAATVAKLLAAKRELVWDAVVNIQGDMPFIRGEVIDQAVKFLLSSPPEFVMGTIAMPLVSAPKGERFIFRERQYHVLVMATGCSMKAEIFLDINISVCMYCVRAFLMPSPPRRFRH